MLTLIFLLRIGAFPLEIVKRIKTVWGVEHSIIWPKLLKGTINLKGVLFG